MAAPAYVDSHNAIVMVTSGLASSGIMCSYPETVNADDIVVCQIQTKDWFTTVILPDGWTHIISIDYVTSYVCHWIWKRAAGTEGNGTIRIYLDEPGGAHNLQITSQMHGFSGCMTTGNPVEQAAAVLTNGANYVTVPALAGNTTGTDRLCVALGHTMDDRTGTDNATNYIRRHSIKTTAGLDAGAHCYTYVQAAAGNPGADQFSISSSEFSQCCAFALLPIGAGASGYPQNVNGVASANIGKINGIATADITKVNGIS